MGDRTRRDQVTDFLEHRREPVEAAWFQQIACAAVENQVRIALDFLSGRVDTNPLYLMVASIVEQDRLVGIKLPRVEIE
jgi:hypothetical protein